METSPPTAKLIVLRYKLGKTKLNDPMILPTSLFLFRRTVLDMKLKYSDKTYFYFKTGTFLSLHSRIQ